jgi:uncharacterized protein
MTERKAALVTGGTSGIGAAFARRLAREGYDLVLTGRRAAQIEAVAAQIRRAHGVEVRVLLAELGDAAQLDTVVEAVRATPALEFLVNNAGFALRGKFHAEPIERHERMLDVHVRATMKLTHAALPRMLERGRGNIVNVSSMAAFIPYPRNAMYSATKALLTNFSETLRLELAGTGVRVQALCPGLTRTDFHTRMGMDAKRVYAGRGLSRALTPEEVVDCSFACLAKDRVVCLPGLANRWRSLAASKLPRALVYRVVTALFGGEPKADRL